MYIKGYINVLGGDWMNLLTLLISVVLLNAFAYFTIVMRPKIYGVALFKPMIKNFKLSLLPFVVLLGGTLIFYLLLYFSTLYKVLYNVSIIFYIFVIIVWILLLPNSGYLITELNFTHRSQDEKNVPIWYDIVSITAFALSGIINTLANIVMIQLIGIILVDPGHLTFKYYSSLVISAFVINMLVSVGVYLGRAIRFNSWDILHITRFIKKLIANFKQEGEWRNFCLFVAFHTAFFMIMYVVLGIPSYFIF